MSRRGVVLFTRDLRVHDNAALAAASRECGTLVPLFVLDNHLLRSVNRVAFLLESLTDLRASLGGALVIRHGDAVEEIGRFEPDTVYVSEDVSGYARARERRLRQRFAVRPFPGVTVVRPGALAAQGSDHYRVFTPYWRAWGGLELPSPIEVRLPVRLPKGVDPGRIPELDELVTGSPAPALFPGGEDAALERFRRFDPQLYEAGRNDLAAGTTTRLSPYLHFGCISPAAMARRAAAAGAEELLRQLCWRDFYAQLLAAHAELAHDDLRPARRPWLDDREGFDAWRQGQTGFPVVDAAMRQLRQEGWMPNRARMIVASFLTKHLLVDWRSGAAEFLEHLVDGDLASNAGNWQWVAGTGTDARPGRVFNPTLHGRRYDPTGDYVRKFVPELASLPAASAHDPAPAERRAVGYPDPIVAHHVAIQRFRALSRPRLKPLDAKE